MAGGDTREARISTRRLGSPRRRLLRAGRGGVFVPAEARGLEVSSLQQGALWGTVSPVRWRPAPGSSSVMEPRRFSSPSRRCVWPLAVRHRRAERGCPARGAVACLRRLLLLLLLLLQGGCALRVLRPPSPSPASSLALSVSRSPPSTSQPRPSCSLQSAPGPPSVSRCREVSGGWGRAAFGATDLEPADRSRCRRPPAARSAAALGARSWREAVPA